MSTMTVAGRRKVSDPLGAVERYIRLRQRTIRKFDLPGPGALERLTLDEVVRTRRLSSRISNAEAEEFRKAGVTMRRKLSRVPIATTIYEADPETDEGVRVLEASHDLYVHLWDRFPRPPGGVSNGKISKVLHVKRPHLVPILDGFLWRAYGPGAEEAERHHSDRRGRIAGSSPVACHAG